MKKNGKEKINNKLSKEINKMAEAEQGLRSKLQKYAQKNDTKKISGVLNRISVIDEKNTQKLKNIIKKYGWPTISLVGRKSSNLAWLLIQHSNLKFQEECLLLLKKAVKKNDALPKNLAYLIDRIRISKNKPQFFGTQFKMGVNGNLTPFPIYKPKEVNKRRNKYGLDPLKIKG